MTVPEFNKSKKINSNSDYIEPFSKLDNNLSEKVSHRQKSDNHTTKDDFPMKSEETVKF